MSFSPLRVLKSANGFYLGHADEDGPVSRVSFEYWVTEEAAAAALKAGAFTNLEPGSSAWRKSD